MIFIGALAIARRVSWFSYPKNPTVTLFENDRSPSCFAFRLYRPFWDQN
jgi:hypothetical protein